MKQDITDRIKGLCARAVDARDVEWESILVELRSALGEHQAEMRHMAAENPWPSARAKTSQRDSRLSRIAYSDATVALSGEDED